MDWHCSSDNCSLRILKIITKYWVNSQSKRDRNDVRHIGRKESNPICECLHSGNSNPLCPAIQNILGVTQYGDPQPEPPPVLEMDVSVDEDDLLSIASSLYESKPPSTPPPTSPHIPPSSVIVRDDSMTKKTKIVRKQKMKMNRLSP